MVTSCYILILSVKSLLSYPLVAWYSHGKQPICRNQCCHFHGHVPWQNVEYFEDFSSVSSAKRLARCRVPLFPPSMDTWGNMGPPGPFLAVLCNYLNRLIHSGPRHIDTNHHKSGQKGTNHRAEMRLLGRIGKKPSLPWGWCVGYDTWSNVDELTKSTMNRTLRNPCAKLYLEIRVIIHIPYIYIYTHNYTYICIHM